MKTWVILCTTLLTANCLLAQNNLELDLDVKGLEHYVSPQQDSVFISGIENEIQLAFSHYKLTDTLYFYLKEHEPAWQKSKYPQIKYSNLPGGSYTLYYKFNKGGQTKEIKVEILKATWQQWWFWPSLVLYALLLLGVGIYMFLLYNFRQKMKVENMRNFIAADLHDEVGSNLSSIAIYSEILRKKITAKMPELLPLLENITRNSKESVNLMQDTVWAINPKNDSSILLFKRLGSFAKELLQSKDIAYEANINLPENAKDWSLEQRKNIYLILKEGLNNIAKHSNATKASLKLFKEGGRIIIELKDNGKGFKTDSESTGNGLFNLKERAVESGFNLEVKSELNKGTCICIKI